MTNVHLYTPAPDLYAETAVPDVLILSLADLNSMFSLKNNQIGHLCNKPIMTRMHFYCLTGSWDDCNYEDKVT